MEANNETAPLSTAIANDMGLFQAQEAARDQGVPA
jgi:hypothetical protein